jgi:hypothetical protein
MEINILNSFFKSHGTGKHMENESVWNPQIGILSLVIEDFHHTELNSE